MARTRAKRLTDQVEYLAVPDPTGQRRATLKRLRAAVNMEAKLRAKALERMSLMNESKSLQSSTKAKERMGRERVGKPSRSPKKARKRINRVTATKN